MDALACILYLSVPFAFAMERIRRKKPETGREKKGKKKSTVTPQKSNSGVCAVLMLHVGPHRLSVFFRISLTTAGENPQNSLELDKTKLQ